MFSNKKFHYEILLSLLLFTAAGSLRFFSLPGLPLLGKPAMKSHALEDMAATIAGARRLGGDVAFIQLLQYFSTHENTEADKKISRPDFLPESLRFASLSPYFHSAYLYSAGCLAFVLERPEEALTLLDLAVSRDPTFWRYHLYAGAIVYRQNADTKKVTEFLEEAMRYPDCPAMLENVLANIYKKAGNYRRAAEIYAHMIDTSKDKDYVSLARQKLDEMRKEGLR